MQPTRLYELLHNTDFQDVADAMVFFGMMTKKPSYKVQLKSLSSIYDELKKHTIPVPSNWTIEIYADTEETDTDPDAKHPINNPDEVLIYDTKPKYQSMRKVTYHIHGISPSHKHRKERFGLDFTPWDEYIGMKISKHTLMRYAPHFIIALCIWDMTFYGCTEERMNKEKERILDIAKESMEHPEKCISLEDLEKNLGLDVD